ncbi:MAG: ATP-binding cassette domain-containing protein [Mycoplasmatales bacterium]
MNIINLKVKYNQETIINNLNFQIANEEIIAIVGKSGSGKTTLLKAILNNIDYEGIIQKENKNIGYMPQDLALFEFKTVYQNIILPLKIQAKNIDKQKIDKLLKDFEIYQLKDVKVQKISGGQKSRVALIRAIVNEDKLWLLDEPLSKLDYITKYESLTIIKNLQKKYKISIIYVTHDLDEAVTIANKIFIMNPQNYQLLKLNNNQEQIKQKIINELKSSTNKL